MPSDPGPTVDGVFYPAGTSRPLAATLTATGGALSLTAGGLIRPVPDGFRVSERLTGVARALTLPDGGRFVTEDGSGFSALLATCGHRDRGGLMNWLEQRGRLMMVLLVALTLLLVLGLRLMIPAASHWLAHQIPPAIERQIGRGTLTTLDHGLFSPTTLPEEEQRRISALFNRLRDTAGLPPEVTLEFRQGNRLKANAVALPGGPVVLTDEMVALIPQDDALAGILAHELGHLHARHGLQQMIRSSLWLVSVTLYIGDDAGLSDLVSGSTLALIDSGYSRDDERDADTYALALTARAGFSPNGLSDALTALRSTCRTDCDSGSLFSTHPGLTERIEQARPH